jgi:hypothetical protein
MFYFTRPPCVDAHMPQLSPLKACLNAPQNMRNGPLVQASLTFPAIKKYPHKIKGPGLYSF